MSLHVLANHMAAHGRGPDSMLVHMSPQEVQSLQELAQKNGGSLTINPKTGLPEAGFLDSILPIVAGAALNFFVPGAGAAVGNLFGLGASAGTGMLVGGLTGLASGSLEKGLMAGMGAYGGAGLAEGLVGSGAEALSAKQIAAEQAANGLGAVHGAYVPSPEMYQGALNAGRGDLFSEGLANLSTSQGRDAALNAMGGGMGALKYGAAAAAPILADQMVSTTTKVTPTDTGYIRQKVYDPISGTYSEVGPVKASEFGNRSFSDIHRGYADGGIVALADGGVADMYQNVLGRTAKPEELSYWNNAFATQGITDPAQQLAQFRTAAAPEVQGEVNNIYRNVLGRDADVGGLNYWTNALTTGNQSLSDVYQGLLGAANQNKEVVNKGIDLPIATSAYTGYEGSDKGTVADEWVRNTLGREVTDADRQSTWYKQAMAGSANPEAGLANYNNFLASIGRAPTTNMADVAKASQLKPLTTSSGTSVVTDTGVVLPVVTKPDGTQVVVNPTTQTTDKVDVPTTLSTAGTTTLPVGVSGNQTATINPNGTISMNTGTPNMPVGGYTGMQSLRDAYTKGGGSLGYVPYTPKTIEEFNAKYSNTGDSKAAYDYLMGKGAYPTKSGVGQIMRPYAEATLGLPAAGNRPYTWNQALGKYERNPDYVRPMRDSSGNVTYSMSQTELKDYLDKNKNLSGQELYDWAMSNNLTAQDIADAQGVPLSKIYAQFRDAKKATDVKKASDATASETPVIAKTGRAAGGAIGYSVGGGLGSLGGYSDGGQLLRGPGDGVSDSIPASIGQSQQPARLADGEFVVPARIVSELGNGSTEAGARKLYAMMDRVQRARGKTTGKDRVAANTSADKYLPA